MKYSRPLIAGLVSAILLTGLFAIAGVVFHVSNLKPSLFLLAFLSAFLISFILFEFLAFRKLRALQEESEKEILKLKDMEKFRRDFIGDVSHELKTPIFAIEGFIETLLDGALEDPKVNRRFLGKALRHAERLSSLVQDILTLSQAETGDLSMQLEVFSVHELIRETIDSLEPKFTKKGRNIICLVQANRLERVKALADRSRIQQVLSNLVENAVKYGDAKGIVTVETSLSPDGKLIITVRDNGPGIEAEHLPRLFERFYRVDKSRSREKGGTGLGLAICKHLIEAHKEKIWVESSPGNGATFSFSLRRADENTKEDIA